MVSLTTNPDQSNDSVLIIDESSEDIGQLHQMLDGFDVHFATDETMALAMMDELQPAIVVIGANSTGFDRFVLCQQLGCSVVMLVNNPNVDDMVKSFSFGAVDYLPTPVNTEVFRLRTQAHIVMARAAKPKQQTLSQVAVMPEAESGMEEQDRQKVLIVDDSISNIQVLNEILGDDYEIFFATNGKQAIEMALEEQPDLIVLDVVMPQMDGHKVCEKLKTMQETKHIGIIFVTALNEVQDEAKGLRLGAIDYIAKPFSAHIVRARMHNHMELVKHRKKLSSLSMTDGMTGIANRRQFDQVIHRELHRAVRNKEHFSLFLIDIDNFKKYNDHYGHVNGDECLKEIATAIAISRVRMTDFVARYGGEEFAVVLPNTDREGARVMANKMLNAITNLGIAHVNNNGFGIVTASVGVQSLVPDSQMSITSLIKQADEALYKAKSLGRNRIVFIEDHS
jgi:two-component system cell cycle response regulator